jgi:hypothetical protein
MKRFAWISVAAALGLVAGGCILTSGQVELYFDLPDIAASSPDNLIGETVDLNEEEDYTDHKEDLQGVTNLAVLGVITNNVDSTPIDVEVWITPDLTNYTNDEDLKADEGARRLWGPFALGAGETVQIDWDASAALFKEEGKSVLLQEVKGDGTFTVYAIGTQGDYNFSVDQGVLVLTIDIGI